MTETIVAPSTRTANRYEIRLLLIPFLSLGFAFFDRQTLSFLAPYTGKDFGLANAGLPKPSVGGALVVVALCLALKERRRLPPDVPPGAEGAA